MPNYQNGKIYKLTSFQTDKIYIGSTCQSLAVRKAGHKCGYKLYMNGKGKKVLSYELFELGDVDIVLLENVPCETREQLYARERYYIENTDNCVNKCIPTRTITEWAVDNREKLNSKNKLYKEANKDKIKVMNRKYRDANKDIIKKKKLEYYEANKDIIKKKKLEYYEANKEAILLRCNTKYDCSICNGRYNKSNKARHLKSRKHIDALNLEEIKE
jgi:hypothetical protein